jgi:hypothetical protein
MAGNIKKIESVLLNSRIPGERVWLDVLKKEPKYFMSITRYRVSFYCFQCRMQINWILSGNEKVV